MEKEELIYLAGYKEGAGADYSSLLVTNKPAIRNVVNVRDKIQASSQCMPLEGIWAEAWERPVTKPKKALEKNSRGKGYAATQLQKRQRQTRQLGQNSPQMIRLSSNWGGKTSWCCVRRLTWCSCKQSSKLCSWSRTVCQSHLSHILSPWGLLFLLWRILWTRKLWQKGKGKKVHGWDC